MKNTQEPEFFSKQVTDAKRFFIEGAAEKSTTIKVVCGGCEQTGPEFRINRESFPYYSLEFVAKGNGTAILAGREYQLAQGTIFSYGPGISQVITAAPNSAMTKYFIDFTGGRAKDMIQKYADSVATAIRVSRPDAITRIFDDIISHGLSDSPYRSIICSTLLEYLFYRIAETTVTEETKLTRALTTYQQCRQHIKENFVTLKSLTDIAEACSIDNAYLCRLFKRFDTQSPYQYLTYLKMAYAAQQLQSPDVMVKEIAYSLGFDDPFHFSRTFRKVFGIAPRSFKRLR